MRREGLGDDAFGSGPAGFSETHSSMCCFCVVLFVSKLSPCVVSSSLAIWTFPHSLTEKKLSFSILRRNFWELLVCIINPFSKWLLEPEYWRLTLFQPHGMRMEWGGPDANHTKPSVPSGISWLQAFYS